MQKKLEKWILKLINILFYAAHIEAFSKNRTVKFYTIL